MRCDMENSSVASALPAEKYGKPSVTAYVTRNKKGEITAEKWRAVFPYRDEGGRRKQKTVTLKTEGHGKGRGGKPSVQAQRTALLEAESIRQMLNEQAEQAPENHETVAEYFAKYVEERANSIEKSSANELRRILNTHIAPTIGKIELDKLTPDDVAEWVTKLGKSYAPSTVKKCLTNLRSAMRQAVDRDRLVKDPTRGVKNPKQVHRNPNALDAAGRAKAAQFIALDPAKPLNVGFALALYMGLREGEICGLMWKCVDLDSQTLSIERTIGRDGSKWYIKEPKNGGSRRKLFIPTIVFEMLKARYADAKAQCLQLGNPFNGDMFVTGGADGSFMQPHYLSHRWRIAADALELIGTEGNRPTFHDLRHTFATAAITAGADVKTVSSMMGHANAAMTLNTYASADDEAKKRGAMVVERAYMADVAQHAKDGAVIELGRTGTDN